MELGGNAPALVFSDADIETAARDLAALKFGNCGQICVAPNRIFVEDKVFEQFKELFVREAQKVRVGFGREEQPTMGPFIDAAARSRVIGMVDDAVNQGARVVCGGRIPPTIDKGYFYEPTVLENVTSTMRVYREVIFGPVAPLVPFHDEDAAIGAANDTECGLVAYAYTADLRRSRRLSERLEFGEVQINGFKYSIYLPHGGVKESGIGKDCSHLALDDYLVKKRVTIRIRD
jgi:succinate-semialdehyde dehydrogenase / glutarate-semialdehyde dehydrogenase